MAEYIEREYLLEDIDASMTDSGMGYIIGQILKRYVNRQTPADVAPVRHGYWSDYGWGVCCTNCGISLFHQDENNNAGIEPSRFDFCPNCGAKMDGGE